MPVAFAYIFGGACMIGGIAFSFVVWVGFQIGNVFAVVFPLAFGIGAAIWYSFAVYFFSIPLKKKMMLNSLKQRGVRINTKFFNVELNPHVRINYEYPYVIQSVGVHPKTQEKIIFKSDNIWFNPERMVPDNIQVIVDPENPKNYVMDTSFLSKELEKF